MEYSRLVEVYEKISSTSKRLEKTYHIAELLKSKEDKDMNALILLLQGKVFPTYDEKNVGVSSRTLVRAISISSGVSQEKVEDEWRKKGDLGEVASHLMKNKVQSTLFSESLTVKKVFSNLRKLAELEGKGSFDQKIKLISELLTSAGSKEAKYVTRTALEDLRVGVSEGTIRDSIVWAYMGDELGLSYDPEKNKLDIESRDEYNKALDLVQEAYDTSNDFAKVCELLEKDGKKGLKKIKMEVGIPVRAMLALKAKDVNDAFERVGSPAAFEYKYDGFRAQIHKGDGKIRLFTRRLEEVTNQFPDLTERIEKHIKGKSFILDAEVVGLDAKTGKYLPFQSISQRIRRKYDIKEMSQKFPVELNIFDIMMYEGGNMIKEPFEKRRELLESIVTNRKKQVIAAKKITSSDPKEVEAFFKEAKEQGNEGLMAKKLDAPYKPGARTGYMVKIKETMENLDLVIVGAEWGEGKRANWLSSFTLACVDEGEFLEIGKVGTGIKEKEEGVSFEKLTNVLNPLITEQKGREVRIKPKIVVEVTYEEIQKSPTYSSGYALRFPRVLFIRDDRRPEDASTLSYVEELYYEK